ncbi:MAG TPA: amidase [Solirubrobacteraceae bacterium]|jgi:amidase|nr:amidase [Solirubrobacteraceae bacterium]
MDAADLAFAGIARQAELIASGELSARDLLEVYLERIQRLDPQLNAFRVVLGERARMEADQADARRKAGSPPARRPLLGVPFAVKDDIDVAGEVTGVGTNAYGEPAREDAEVVRRLRAAGAVIVGKTNVPELCAFPWTESSTRGVTRNPWNIGHTPGGSSGGTAAAVAAGLVGAALGSDGGGSIRFPAAYCGLFGLKTQRGRVPMAPHVDAWHGLSVNGVLTRSVGDTALFHDAIAEGPADPGAPIPPPVSFLEAATSGADRAPLRIALSTNLPPSPLTRLHPENGAAVQETAQLLRSLGHEVREVEVDHGPLAPPPEFTVRYLRGLHDEAVALAHPERLERRMRNVTLVGGLLPASLVGWMRAREAAYEARLNSVLADHDVLLSPVTPAPAPRIGACEGRGWLWTTAVAAATVPYAAPWNVTGQPACSVPAGFAADGLPRAVQLVGRANDEATLLSLAAQIEAERPWAERRPEQFS